MKEEDIIKNIKRKEIGTAILFFLISLPFNIGFFVMLNQPDSSMAWVALIFAIGFDWMTISSIKSAMNPLEDDVFKKYGSPKKVKEMLNDLNKNKIYEDKNIIMSKKYITNKNSFSDLIAFDDVLGVHKLKTTKMGMPYYYGVILTDKYGQEHRYTYNVLDQKECDKLLEMTASLCKYAEKGYTKEQRKYIKENTEKLPKEYKEEPEEEYTCDNCGAYVKEDDKICPSCGATFEDDDTEEIVESKKEKSGMDKKYKDLTKLKKLLDDKIITKEEFEKEKKKILKG